MDKKNIFDFSLLELEEYLVERGFKKTNALQIFEWIYDKYNLNFAEMTNLSKELRNFLINHFSIELLTTLIQQQSKDGTIKFLFKLADNKTIETVLMPQNYGLSVCITTQVGCNMGCTFCASGIIKKQRNLELFEIVQQIYMVNIFLKEQKIAATETKNRVSHVVIMGIGEPFDNYDNVIRAIGVINHNKALAIGARHITVSTCGLVAKIRSFAELKNQVNLAISLHASNDQIRNEIMPINKVFNIEKLLDAVKYYISKTNRRVTFEYILIDNINDSKESALELSKLLKNINGYVNLIPYNEVRENKYKKSPRVNSFYQILKQNNINAVIRKEFGADINAACGQLRINYMGELKNEI